MQIQSVSDLAERVARDPQLEAAIKENPAMAIRDVAAGPIYTKDILIYRIVVAVLGLVILTTIGGGLFLVYVDKAVPEAVVALGSVALGALAGLLAPSPTRS